MNTNERLEFNWMEKKDRFNDLPDPLIHHIISFLPSTKQAIQSGILSKRWRNQWTYIPYLFLDSTGMSCNDFIRFFDKVLAPHNCSKFKKFHLKLLFPLVPRLLKRIQFVLRRGVEELVVNCDGNFQTINHIFLLSAKLRFLKVLSLEYCRLSVFTIQIVLSSSHVLELFELKDCGSFDEFNYLVIESKSLKKLVLRNMEISVIEISCPNLEELSLKKMVVSDHASFHRAVENVLTASPKLESLELVECARLERLIVVSKALKRLVLGELKYAIRVFEISCPNLHILEFSGFLGFGTCKLVNLPAHICASLDFELGLEENDGNFSDETREKLAMDILQQLRHVRELKIGTRFMKVLSGNLSWPLLSIKCLTLNDPNLHEHLPGIACALKNSPVLESLVIIVPVYRSLDLSLQVNDDSEMNYSGVNYWNSTEMVFDCLESHLKTIKVMGLPERDDKCELVLTLVEFLLKNATILEKMSVVLQDYGTSFAAKVSTKLSSMSKRSKHAIVEFICYK